MFSTVVLDFIECLLKWISRSMNDKKEIKMLNIKGIFSSKRKPGHLRADCPNLKSQPTKEKGEEKVEYKKGKMKTQKVFWVDSALESSEEEVEDVTNLCLMANNNLYQSDQDEKCSHKKPSKSISYLDSGCS
ncbi:uncharacterized protein LOC110107656 isoform X2 [Dendrobium catenatum]|uniref:uncharacterized protein LOC110107656 isoform X2 n=1 Tax=Dendrobium catenatum TaxID=906689 RepID=UPI00109F3F57|nr:uncharacterized protein LOC110107656 isoform X2 [Dendrobium catenatum]